MPKYRVTHYQPNPIEIQVIPEEYIGWVDELIRDYGLSAFGRFEVYFRWKEHSENMCAGWLHPHKEDVESVFGVTLEEITDPGDY
jgi:hypothetical protein